MARRKTKKRLGGFKNDLYEAKYEMRSAPATDSCRRAKAAIRRAERSVRERRGKLGWQFDDAEVHRHIRQYERDCGKKY